MAAEVHFTFVFNGRTAQRIIPYFSGKVYPKPEKGLVKIMIMDRIALILSIIGGLNWGLIGIFKFDLVAYIFGGQTATVSRVIYTLVGLAAVWCITLLFREREITGDKT